MGELAKAVLEMLPNVELFEDLSVVKDPSFKYDILFSASYPGRIDSGLCKSTALGAVNIHTSLLPEGRGSHPLNWALIWGKDKTGITIHKITDTYDAGDICLQEEVPIFETDNIVSLRERVEALFPKVVAEFFNDPIGYLRDARKQNQALASYAQKRRPEDSELNMHAPARDVYNLYRACHPEEYPAFFMVGGIKYLVTGMQLVNGELQYQFKIAP